MVLPDKGTPNLQNELPLNISYVEVPTLVKSEMCLNSEPDLQNQINIKVDKLNNYAPSVLDVDIEKGKAEIPMCNEESGVILKSDDSVAVCLYILINVLCLFNVLEMLSRVVLCSGHG